MRLFWQEHKKYLQYYQNSATYHPMNPDSDVKAVNLFSFGKYFIYFIFDVPHYI